MRKTSFKKTDAVIAIQNVSIDLQQRERTRVRTVTAIDGEVDGGLGAGAIEVSAPEDNILVAADTVSTPSLPGKPRLTIHNRTRTTPFHRQTMAS